jgi:hypothetical protein
LFSKYGITLEQFVQIAASQNGVRDATTATHHLANSVTTQKQLRAAADYVEHAR